MPIRITPASRATLEALHAVLGDALGLSREPAPPAYGEAPAIVHELTDSELRQLANKMELAKPQSIGRRKRENLIALFDGVDEADVREHLEADAAAEEARKDEVLAYLNDAELSVADVRELAVALGAMAAETAVRAQRRTAIAAIAAAGCSLEDVQNAV